jgi:hypothetical protein
VAGTVFGWGWRGGVLRRGSDKMLNSEEFSPASAATGRRAALERSCAGGW